VLEPKKPIDLNDLKGDSEVDQKTISVYDNQAESYAELTNDSPDKTLLEFISILKANAYILDLGCGPAQHAATMRSHGMRVDPVDASAEMVRLANENYNIGARQAKFTEINGIDLYDAVWASFSLLHATRAEFPQILTSLYSALKQDGYFHLTMKLGEGEERDKLGRFYTYYSQDELSDYLKTTGFTIENITIGEAMGLAGFVEPWIMFTSQKQNTS